MDWIKHALKEKRMNTNQIVKAQNLSSETWEQYVVPFLKD
jgi:hypothetical protein